MTKPSYLYLFLLTIGFLIILLCALVNGNNQDDAVTTTVLDKRLVEKLTADRLYNLIERAHLNQEEMNRLIQDLLQTYPNRRSSFHAMRGKRRITLS